MNSELDGAVTVHSGQRRTVAVFFASLPSFVGFLFRSGARDLLV